MGKPHLEALTHSEYRRPFCLLTGAFTNELLNNGEKTAGLVVALLEEESGAGDCRDQERARRQSHPLVDGFVD